MQKFKRQKTHDEIVAACKAGTYELDTSNYDEKGSDWITIGGQFGDKLASILYSSWNGKFFGKTEDGIDFNSDSDTHENEPWFQEMLNFFYISEKADAA